MTATRSRLMAPLSGQGTMALLELDAAATEALIADYPQVSLGIYASPRQTVIAGPTEQIDALVDKVRQQNGFASRVNIEVAPHNQAMDALQPQMRSELADLTPRPPTIPIISTTYADVGARFSARPSTPSTGRPTCATRCASSRRSPPPGPITTPSSKSARTRC